MTEIFIIYRNTKTLEYVGRKRCLRSPYGGVEKDVFTTWTLAGGEWSVSCLNRCRVQL